mmetsp:Transcript_22016/g.46335  ORF Transcript_22016/g.46335 Transcript_22016/m.46335 type:complete len:323 (+) Transcript_22016:78-1046(+)
MLMLIANSKNFSSQLIPRTFTNFTILGHDYFFRYLLLIITKRSEKTPHFHLKVSITHILPTRMNSSSQIFPTQLHHILIQSIFLLFHHPLRRNITVTVSANLFYFSIIRLINYSILIQKPRHLRNITSTRVLNPIKPSNLPPLPRLNHDILILHQEIPHGLNTRIPPKIMTFRKHGPSIHQKLLPNHPAIQPTHAKLHRQTLQRPHRIPHLMQRRPKPDLAIPARGTPPFLNENGITLLPPAVIPLGAIRTAILGNAVGSRMKAHVLRVIPANGREGPDQVLVRWGGGEEANAVEPADGSVSYEIPCRVGGFVSHFQVQFVL